MTFWHVLDHLSLLGCDFSRVTGNRFLTDLKQRLEYVLMLERESKTEGRLNPLRAELVY